MPSRKRGSNIKKDRIMMILKSRKLTITKLAAETGYDRRSLNYAISREYMDNQTLNDICAYLNVAPPFFTGVFKLHESSSDPCGYFVPEFNYETLLSGSAFRPAGEDQPYFDLLIEEGKNGIPDGNEVQFYDESFVSDNSGYLIPPVRSALQNTVLSVLNQDPDYLEWQNGTDPGEDQHENG